VIKVEIAVDNKSFNEAVIEAVKALDLVPKSTLTGRTISLDEFRKKYCGGKSKDWVKEQIFYTFKPDFVQNIHPGHGSRFIIFERPAAEWMEKHRKEIEWDA
jgi:hypothetical protein